MEKLTSYAPQVISCNLITAMAKLVREMKKNTLKLTPMKFKNSIIF
jgi:hypothetical protein